MHISGIYNEFRKARKTALVDFVREQIIDGKIKTADGKTRIFLATNGSWQEKYLSFYEVLHDKYVARYFAQCLLDMYMDAIRQGIEEIDQSFLPESEKETQRHKWYTGKIFNKIVTVTVSSQLIGVAMRDLIRHDKNYALFLNKEESNPLKASPTLSILSSYYSFDEEKPFHQITNTDRIIIVNDVIATGHLVYNLMEKLKSRRTPQIQAVMSIADTRIPPDRQMGGEAPSYFDLDPDKTPFFTLASFADGIDIRKFKRPHPREENITIKRINPLLNAVVELKSKHSEENKILFPEPSQLINETIFQPQLFKTGHFMQSLTHTGYLTDMHNIFSCEGDNSTGEKLLQSLQEELNKKWPAGEPVQVSLINIGHNLEKIRLSAPKHKDVIQELAEKIILLRDRLGAEETDRPASFIPDYIFHPIFSGIEQLNHSILSRIFQTPVDNIIGLQRFDTNKGWRFPFPPKRFNQLCKNKTILILDSGSLTGESLVQLVDNIAFLDVRQIVVLSVITRIEDFYREFYAKLRSAKVKLLRQADETVPAESTIQPEHIIPLTILFGCNLHIPVFPSAVSCPFCRELQELEYYEDLFDKFKPSAATRNYIEQQKKDLRRINLGQLEEYTIPSYLPLRNDRIDSIELFIMRDRLGKIESFRFYPEYFTYFDNMTAEAEQCGLYQKEVICKFEQVLAAILHEPRLLNLVKDLLVDVKDLCQRLLEDIVILQSQPMGALEYSWPRSSLVKLVFIFWGEQAYKMERFEQLLKFSLDDPAALNYLSFLLWKSFFKIEKNASLTTAVTDLLLEVSKKMDSLLSADQGEMREVYQSETIRDMVKDITENLKNTTIKDVKDAFYNLLKFFISSSSKMTHDELSKVISRLAARIQSKFITPDTIAATHDMTGMLLQQVKTQIYDNLQAIKNEPALIHPGSPTYKLLFDARESVCADFESIYNEYKLIKDGKGPPVVGGPFEKKLAQVILRIEEYQSLYLLKNKAFHHFCIRFRCNLSRCIESVLEMEKVKIKMSLRAGFSCQLEMDEDLMINAHEEILAEVFAEIISNAATRPGNDHSALLFSATVTQNSEEISFTVSQQAPFDSSGTHKGGYHKEVLPVLRLFGNKDSVEIINEPSFSIKVKFSKHIPDNF